MVSTKVSQNASVLPNRLLRLKSWAWNAEPLQGFA